MSNRKATKRALLTSVTALVMCVVMLVGTTFAWFTDTASTSVNKIQAGNLDVALEYATAWDKETGKVTKWESAEGKTLQFKTADGRTDNILWEPGCRYELPELRVVNKGNLALKYMIKITGIKGNAKLNEVIKWTITDGAANEDIVAAATDTTPAQYKLLNANAAHTLTIMGEMDKNAGNDYQGLSIDGISITVYATQYTYEKDSFNDQYDKDAAYKGTQEFTSGTHVLDKGGVALNPNDIAVKVSGQGTVVTITGGYYDGGAGGDNQCVRAENGATVTIKDGTFTVGGDANGFGNSVIASYGGNIIIEGGFFYTNYSYNNKYYVLNQKNDNPGTITVKGGTFVNFNPAGGDDYLQPTNFVAEGYDVITETKANGDKWYTVVKGTGVTAGTQDALDTAISGNGVATVKLTEDGTYNLTDGIAKSKDVTFIGTKDTVIDVCQNLDGESGVKAGMNYQDGATLAFKGVTILGQASGNYGGIVRAATTFEDCTIKGKLTLYGDATFINCTFENQDDYSIWTWGAKNVTFEGCTFMTGGKAINLYGGADHPEAPTTVLTVNNCTFNDSNNGAKGKAAIEVGNDYGATYILTVNNVNVNGFAVNTEGANTGSKIWANKKSMDAAHLTVTIDGTKVQ